MPHPVRAKHFNDAFMTSVICIATRHPCPLQTHEKHVIIRRMERPPYREGRDKGLSVRLVPSEDFATKPTVTGEDLDVY